MYTLPARGISDIPVIETDRLILRAARNEDYQPTFDMWQMDEYVRFAGNRRKSSGEVWTDLQSKIGAWGLFGFGYLMFEHRETGKVIGSGGFTLSRRSEMSPSLPMIPEAGWGIAPEYWGQGYTGEAMRGVLNWMREQDPQFPAQCIIDPGNTASERIALRLGFEKKGDRIMYDKVINWYELTRPGTDT
ncbi:GNAT family N-acetyltransferase [Ponticaulis sp.]|uniref:GNAT family N-acetyltransferase n=1 Tax=Ponticaulis sp. TaxID=2020902 RepID=UPI000B6FBE80|nr:GNAT family N-acetyltransferase [Ponticaulis sp.]MAI89348.1 GNAT family N-acetyltransferase [Ponticaulis sp.]OUY00936.1 MAG: hypothetical protein CBB65_02785 [Hyphomonadaceae bacterium TMED5]|tara:strand:- start:2535 stop:3101 length:567 start_codon:yes stop_codon:yes gene_type:complete